MNDTLQILVKMDWPAAIALVGLGFGICAGTIVRAVRRTSMRAAELHYEERKLETKTSVEIAQINAAKANGAVPAVTAREY